MIVEHVVKSGDTLSWIAKKYKTTIAQIAKLNNIADPNKLKTGQVLKIMTDGADGTTNQIKGSVVDSKIVVPEYYVVVGFEVDNPKAYVNGVHHLNVDTGHAFFYVVDNGKISKFFSFGPLHPFEINWLNQAAAAYVKGTPDFSIPSPTKLFRINLSLKQVIALEAETETYRKKINSGELYYKGINNDTCAETAREILTKLGISTPEGKGPVVVGSVNLPEIISKKPVTPSVDAVNPYRWHDNFKKAGFKEASRTEVFGKYPEKIQAWQGQPDPVASQWK